MRKLDVVTVCVTGGGPDLCAELRPPNADAAIRVVPLCLAVAFGAERSPRPVTAVPGVVVWTAVLGG